MLKLRVGRYYLTREGGVEKVVCRRAHPKFPFLTESGESYTYYGGFYASDLPYPRDLIAECDKHGNPLPECTKECAETPEPCGHAGFTKTKPEPTRTLFDDYVFELLAYYGAAGSFATDVVEEAKKLYLAAQKAKEKLNDKSH